MQHKLITTHGHLRNGKTGTEFGQVEFVDGVAKNPTDEQVEFFRKHDLDGFKVIGHDEEFDQALFGRDRGAWSPNTFYSTGDTVSFGGQKWQVGVSFTSGPTLSTDNLTVVEDKPSLLAGVEPMTLQEFKGFDHQGAFDDLRTEIDALSMGLNDVRSNMSPITNRLDLILQGIVALGKKIDEQSVAGSQSDDEVEPKVRRTRTRKPAEGAADPTVDPEAQG